MSYNMIYSKALTKTELMVIGLKLLADGSFSTFLINNIILPIKC